MSRMLNPSSSTDRLSAARLSTDPQSIDQQRHHARHLSRRLPTRLALAGMALSTPFLLGACSAQWSSMSPSIQTVHKSAATTQRVQKATAVPASSIRDTGDLDQGSLIHQVSTDGHLLVIHYWTDGKLSTEAGGPVVHLSAALKGADRKHAVKVTRFSAGLDTTVTGSPVSTIQLADDRGEFVLTPPYSYTTALALPAATGAATRTLSVSFDLLVETAPGSGSYFRQTVLDQVVLSRGAEGVTP